MQSVLGGNGGRGRLHLLGGCKAGSGRVDESANPNGVASAFHDRREERITVRTRIKGGEVAACSSYSLGRFLVHDRDHGMTGWERRDAMRTYQSSSREGPSFPGTPRIPLRFDPHRRAAAAYGTDSKCVQPIYTQGLAYIALLLC